MVNDYSRTSCTFSLTDVDMDTLAHQSLALETSTQQGQIIIKQRDQSKQDGSFHLWNSRSSIKTTFSKQETPWNGGIEWIAITTFV